MKLFKVNKDLAHQGMDNQLPVFVLLYVRFCLLFDVNIFVFQKVRKCNFFFLTILI